MVALDIARYLGYFLKTQVIIIPLLEREDDVDEVFAQLCDIHDTLMRIGNTDHGLGGLHGYRAYFFKLVDEMMEQHQRMLRLPGKESL